MPPEATRHAIERSIDRLRKRSFFATLVREEAKFLFFGLLLGALVTGGWLLVAWLRGQEFVAPPVLAIGGAAAALSTLAAVASAAVRQPRAIDVAKAWDDHSGAKDRLSSALELDKAQGRMAAVLMEDAVAEAARVEPRRVYPLTVPRVGWWMPIPVAALFVCAFLPGWLRAETPTNPHLTHTVGGQVAQIKDYVAKEKGKELTRERKEMLERLERLASDLTRDKMKKKDAMAELAKLMEQMRKDKNDEELKKKELEKLLKSLQANDKQKDLNDDMNNGNYDDAANKIQEMIDKQKDEIKKRKEQKAKADELKPLDDRVKELENIKAQLMKLRLSKYNINNMTDVLEMLEAFEGELGDLPDDEIVDGEP